MKVTELFSISFDIEKLHSRFIRAHIYIIQRLRLSTNGSIYPLARINLPLTSGQVEPKERSISVRFSFVFFCCLFPHFLESRHYQISEEVLLFSLGSHFK